MNKFNSSYTGVRMDLLKYISEGNNSVLDVGCATGANGKFLLEEGMAKIVFGIEFNSSMASEAREKGIIVFEGNLNDSDFLKEAINRMPSFDYIVCGDILEHLYNPEEILSELVKKLKIKGRVIISLPNIAHIELLIQVYFKGSWPMNPRGIFDKTHLRWFTKKDALKLVDECGLKVHTYTPLLRSRDALGSTFDWKFRILRTINIEWVTFQHILICEHAS